MSEKLKVEIWSDVVCPFCYIGKRKFEDALKQFSESDDIEIEYKSFQLSPDAKTDPSRTSYEVLADHKGITTDHTKQMSDQVTEVAKSVNLHFDFDRAISANTFNAHRLLHIAKKEGKQSEVKERLLKAYFTDGENVDNIDTLVKFADELNLDSKKVKEMLKSEDFHEEVRTDIYEAQQLGVRGVPFFVFDRKYGVSGAQDPAVFLQTLEKSHEEWSKSQSKGLKITEGESCDVDGNCDS